MKGGVDLNSHPSDGYYNLLSLASFLWDKEGMRRIGDNHSYLLKYEKCGVKNCNDGCSLLPLALIDLSLNSQKIMVW